MSTLKKDAARYYDIIKKHLNNVDALEDVDEFGLTMMANDLALYYNARSECEDNGGVQTTPNGYTAITGYFTVMEKCKANFLKFSEKFGLSPKDRERMLKFKEQKNRTDKFDEI
jgi:P27 family predicted phage terminase small subunit